VASNIAAGAIDIVNTIQSGDAEVDKLTAEIEQQENRIKQLTAFKDYLHTTVIPSIGQMGNNLMIAGENMKHQTQMQLNVGKWKVQEMIRDIRLNIKKISKDFDVHEDLLNIFDKLDETMGVMVDVYDRIQVNNYRFLPVLIHFLRPPHSTYSYFWEFHVLFWKLSGVSSTFNLQCFHEIERALFSFIDRNCCLCFKFTF